MGGHCPLPPPLQERVSEEWPLSPCDLVLYTVYLHVHCRRWASIGHNRSHSDCWGCAGCVVVDAE